MIFALSCILNVSISSELSTSTTSDWISFFFFFFSIGSLLHADESLLHPAHLIYSAPPPSSPSSYTLSSPPRANSRAVDHLQSLLNYYRYLHNNAIECSSMPGISNSLALENTRALILRNKLITKTNFSEQNCLTLTFRSNKRIYKLFIERSNRFII